MASAMRAEIVWKGTCPITLRMDSTCHKFRFHFGVIRRRRPVPAASLMSASDAEAEIYCRESYCRTQTEIDPKWLPACFGRVRIAVERGESHGWIVSTHFASFRACSRMLRNGRIRYWRTHWLHCVLRSGADSGTDILDFVLASTQHFPAQPSRKARLALASPGARLDERGHSKDRNAPVNAVQTDVAKRHAPCRARAEFRCQVRARSAIRGAVATS